MTRAAPILALALTALDACAAPESRPAQGPVAEAVQASIDAGRESFTHEEWNSLLATAVHGRLLDYRSIQARRAELDRYLDRIASAALPTLAPDHLKALLINAYNALTVRSILQNPRVDSIRQIDGIWTAARHRVGGFEVTLDEIEHNLLRPFFKDPRIHFALNCASKSCAPLPAWAYDGDRLEAQMEERARDFLSSRGNVRIEKGKLLLSRYFEWYGDDFSAEGWRPRADTPALFVAAYARPQVAEFIRTAAGRPALSFLDYDWSLNAAVPPDPSIPPSAGR